MREFDHLGHIVSQEGIRPNPAKVHILLNMAIPADVAHLQRFLGLANWFRRFIPNYAATASPLYNLLNKNVQWNWNSECDNAFQTLRHQLTSAPLVIFPDMNKPFVLTVDASDQQLGAALLQENSVGQLQPITYLSRTLTPAERNYPIPEKECLTVVWALSKLHHYVFGQKLIIRTDHRCLIWLTKHRDPSSRLMRWAMALQPYDYIIVYGKGESNVIADCLSRIRLDPMQQLKNEDGEYLFQDLPALSEPFHPSLAPALVTGYKKKLLDRPEIPIFRDPMQKSTVGPRDEHWLGRSVQVLGDYFGRKWARQNHCATKNLL